MIYAEIVYTGEITKDGSREFYLQFYWKDKTVIEQDSWIQYITSSYQLTKDGPEHDIYFSRTTNPAYLISRSFVLSYLAEKKFTPVSENFFFKKSFSFFD